MAEHQVAEHQQRVLVAKVEPVEPELVVRVHFIEVGNVDELDQNEADHLARILVDVEVGEWRFSREDEVHQDEIEATNRVDSLITESTEGYHVDAIVERPKLRVEGIFFQVVLVAQQEPDSEEGPGQEEKHWNEVECDYVAGFVVASHEAPKDYERRELVEKFQLADDDVADWAAVEELSFDVFVDFAASIVFSLSEFDDVVENKSNH